MPDKEKEIETEVDDIDDLLFGSSNDSEDFSDSILTEEDKKVVSSKPKKNTKKKPIKSQPKPRKVSPNPDVEIKTIIEPEIERVIESEPEVEPEIKPTPHLEPEIKPDPVPIEPSIPKDDVEDLPKKNHIDGGPRATEKYEPSGHLRRNRKFQRFFP